MDMYFGEKDKEVRLQFFAAFLTIHKQQSRVEEQETSAFT